MAGHVTRDTEFGKALYELARTSDYTVWVETGTSTTKCVVEGLMSRLEANTPDTPLKLVYGRMHRCDVYIGGGGGMAEWEAIKALNPSVVALDNIHGSSKNREVFESLKAGEWDMPFITSERNGAVILVRRVDGLGDSDSKLQAPRDAEAQNASDAEKGRNSC